MEKLTAKENDLIIDLYNTVKDVPSDSFTINRFHSEGKSCILGHYDKIKFGEKRLSWCIQDNLINLNIWDITRKAYKVLHGDALHLPSIASINNSVGYNGYNQLSIKDRGINFLEDYLIEIGELKESDRTVVKEVALDS